MSAHAFMLGELCAFKNQISLNTIPSFVPPYLGSLSGKVSFFISPSFFFRWKVVLHSTVSPTLSLSPSLSLSLPLSPSLSLSLSSHRTQR